MINKNIEERKIEMAHAHSVWLLSIANIIDSKQGQDLIMSRDFRVEEKDLISMTLLDMLAIDIGHILKIKADDVSFDDVEWKAISHNIREAIKALNLKLNLNYHQFENELALVTDDNVEGLFFDLCEELLSDKWEENYPHSMGYHFLPEGYFETISVVAAIARHGFMLKTLKHPIGNKAYDSLLNRFPSNYWGKSSFVYDLLVTTVLDIKTGRFSTFRISTKTGSCMPSRDESAQEGFVYFDCNSSKVNE